jgi:hypothetical protein
MHAFRTGERFATVTASHDHSLSFQAIDLEKSEASDARYSIGEALHAAKPVFSLLLF